MPTPETFATMWLAKGLNRIKLPSDSPLVGTPKGVDPSLVYQANRKITRKGQNRKKIADQIRTSTRKSAATVVAPPAVPTAPGARNPGFGGAGYSGNNASRLGDQSNPGYVKALPLAPKV